MQLYHSQIQYDYQRVRHIVSRLSELMGRFGYEVLETPIIEVADLFLTKAGDQIIKKLFTFERHGQELALRPEFTAPAAYYYVTEYVTRQPVVRWQFSGPIFEDDPHDAMRNYQRFSIGAELIGMGGPAAEAEIIGMAANGVSAQGITDWYLLIGHSGLTRQLLAPFNLDSRAQRSLLSHLAGIKADGKAHILEQLGETLTSPDAQSQMSSGPFDAAAERGTHQVLDVLLDSSQRGTAMGGRTREDIARRLLQKRKRASERARIEAALDFLGQWVTIDAPPDEAFQIIERLVGGNETAQQSLNLWRTVIDLLAVYEVSSERIRIQPALARSWEYYTGIVFEIRAGNDFHLGGGGRYDELARLIGSQHDVPAVGFAYYVDEMLAVLADGDSTGQPAVSIVIDDTDVIAAAQWAQQLRSRSIAAVLTPEAQALGGNRLRVEENGSARFGNTAYTLSQVDLLIADLGEMKRG